MKHLWLLVLSLFLLTPALAQDPLKTPIWRWMRSLPDADTGLPVSYQVTDGAAGYAKMGNPDSVTGVVERSIVRQGISVYDAALWQIALSLSGEPDDIHRIQKLVDIYWSGSVGTLDNIRAGFGDQPFIYDPENPEAVSSDLRDFGSRGYLFRIIDSRGKYLTDDPLDGKTEMAGFPNGSALHWEDWKPISGENAWVVMAALWTRRALHSNGTGNEIPLAGELARAALLLQASNGGIRMAPIGTYYHLYGIRENADEKEIVAFLDNKPTTLADLEKTVPFRQLGRFMIPEFHMWYYEEISTENNISWYGAMRMLAQVTHNPLYKEAMTKIEGYLKSVWNKEGGYLEQGAHWNGVKWEANTAIFATDVQNWAIACLGPEKIDELFGEGASWRLWQAVRSRSVMMSKDNVIEGIGFTQEHSRLTVEWTAGAILSLRKLSFYYQGKHSDWAEEARRDASLMRVGIDDFRLSLPDDMAAYSYSSLRGWIPFGWFSQDMKVVSLASTAWVALLDAGIDPFVLPAD